MIDQSVRGLKFKLYFPTWGHVLVLSWSGSCDQCTIVWMVCPRLSTVGIYTVEEDQEDQRTLVGWPQIRHRDRRRHV